MIIIMENIVPIIIIIILVYMLYRSAIYDYFTSVRVKSGIDYNEYSVVSLYNDTQDAADVIGIVNLFTVELINKMKAKYLNSTSELPEYVKGRMATLRLMDRFASNSLKENEPESPDATSYTLNKGDVISLCLREKQSGDNHFQKLEDIKFVLLHELTHIITPEHSHTKLFWTNFRFILDFCKEAGLYITPDYENNNINYCGTTITYNPSNDPKLQSYFS
jgi:hypothetical protein